MFAIEKGCEYYGRSKGKLSELVSHCDSYFVPLLVFLMKRFSAKFQSSKCNILGTYLIDSVIPRYQQPP